MEYTTRELEFMIRDYAMLKAKEKELKKEIDEVKKEIMKAMSDLGLESYMIPNLGRIEVAKKTFVSWKEHYLREWLTEEQIMMARKATDSTFIIWRPVRARP